MRRLYEDLMKIKPIKNEEDYQSALKEIDNLFGAEPNTTKGDDLEVLITLLEAYEAQHHIIEVPDPIDSIKYLMESKGVTRKELESCIGNRSRVSEILNRKRKLTLPMIRKIYEKFKIPAWVLING